VSDVEWNRTRRLLSSGYWLGPLITAVEVKQQSIQKVVNQGPRLPARLPEDHLSYSLGLAPGTV